jgi:hypothetical protein
MDRRDAAYALSCVLLALSAACTPGGSTESAGTIARIDTLGAQYGLSLFNPAEASRGPDGNVYVLDRGNAELYRLGQEGRADTLARMGAGPGELVGPTAFTWLGDSALVVLDEGNKRLQFFDRSGIATRTIPYLRGATSAAFDAAAERLYATTFGRGFRIVSNQPRVDPDSLASIVSLRNGEVLGKFGRPRPYEQGALVLIAGNYVHIARNPASGELWVVWPVDPAVARYDRDGKLIAQFERPLAFTPPAPREIPSPSTPLPRADFQQITHDAVADSANRLYVLTPIAAKKGLVGSEGYQQPPQAVDILDETGALQCRLKIPFFASSLALDGPGALLLTDAAESGEVYRVQYTCPKG